MDTPPGYDAAVNSVDKAALAQGPVQIPGQAVQSAVARVLSRSRSSA